MADVTAGSDARTIVIHCVERLKEKFPASQTLDELLEFALPEHRRQDGTLVRRIRLFLDANPKANHIKGTDSWKFAPLHNISSPDELLAYFQRQDNSMGLVVRDLKEGWANAEDGIDQLERENKLLVTRNKKDGHPRMVWANDPSLVAPLDQEFKDLWSQIPLPASEEDVIKELTRMNHTPTGEIQKPEAVVKVVKKKRTNNRGNKQTNTHLSGILRDYSDRRPQGK